MAVKMDRMVVHPEIDQADADSLPVTHDERSVGWTGFSIEGKPVELHVHGVRDIYVWQDGVLLQDDDEILVDAGFIGFLWVHDERADHPYHFLHCHVRVVEVRAFLVERELVDESAAGWDRVLACTRCAIHLDRNLETVPVHRRCFGKVVIHDDANAITPGNLNGWSRSAAVVTPKIDDSARNDFLLHRLGDEMEFLDVSIHAKRKVGHIGCLDWNGRAVFRDKPFLAFHLHSGHVPGHLHLLGGQHFRGSENSCSRENILQKPSPATHAFFLSRSNDRISKRGLVRRNTECRRKCTEAPSTRSPNNPAPNTAVSLENLLRVPLMPAPHMAIRCMALASGPAVAMCYNCFWGYFRNPGRFP